MTHPLPDKAVEAGLARFNEVINDPIMEPCAKCSGKGYHHGFGPGGVEPDWCTDCGGNQFNIRPGEELRAMQAAIETALAAEGLVVVRAEAINYARQMANLCYNYKQSSAVDDRMRRNLDAAQTGFDRAMIEAAREG